ncbi:hypothetical protein DFH29DRAFT_948023 [Suillus ampliporus]|nr:hypothetical protein DFH29DRAFT_948023 [Suillus ampliporus]
MPSRGWRYQHHLWLSRPHHHRTGCGGQEPSQSCRSLSSFLLFSASKHLQISQKTASILFTPSSSPSSFPFMQVLTAKYHNELTQVLADDGSAGEAAESMVWYALGYEMTDANAERSDHLNREDTVMLDDKWRSGWLERVEHR